MRTIEMKKKMCMAIVAMVLLVGVPASGFCDLVYSRAGGILGTEWVGYDFTADVSPFTYEATLTDISASPYFGFDFLFLQIATDHLMVYSPVDLDAGSTSITFGVSPGENVHALIFGAGQNVVDGFNSGSYLFQVNSVPVPATLLLLGSGLFALTALKRRKLQ